MSTQKVPTPRPGSLAWRAVQHLASCPGRKALNSDLAQICEATGFEVTAALSRLLDAGAVRSERAAGARATSYVLVDLGLVGNPATADGTSVNAIEIEVKYACGAYVTSIRGGIRASSTCSAATAAEKFGRKYYGPSFGDVATADSGKWLVMADPTCHAWCGANGVIHVGEEPPTDNEDSSGPLVFAKGPKRVLEAALAVVARHGYQAGVLLVPGVPEAANQRAGMTALIKWLDWAKQRNGKPGTFGVHFGVQFGRVAQLGRSAAHG